MDITPLLNYCRRVKRALLYLIAPPLCAYCKLFLSERAVLCSACKDTITPLVSVVIPITKKYHMPVICIGEYKDPLKKLILSKGWSDYVSSHELGWLMYESTAVAHMQFDIVVPVPLHWSRYAWRGYNQAEEMAKTLAQQLNIPCVLLLKRVKATPLQSSVAHTQREQNVKQVFQLAVHDYHEYRNKRILLVDDLMTTGATLQSAAKTVSRLAPVSLHAVVAARVK